MLTRYEVTRLIGIRALQISEGSEPHVLVSDERLGRDSVYVAALELFEGRMDACVRRGGVNVHISRYQNPPDLKVVLNTRDGKTRT